MELDKFDLAILAILQQDARASLQDISARVGLSTTPCWTRIKKMETEGVIQGYTIRIDPGAVGFRETVIVPSTPDAPNRPVIAPSKVLTEKLRSSPIAKGPANRFCVAEEPWER